MHSIRSPLSSLLLAALYALAGICNAAAADAYPVKPVRVLVGFPPGGPTDAIGRVLFEELSRRIGQSMVIDNRPGAGGTVASDLAAKAPPDGYTVLYGSSALASAPALYKRPDMEPDKFLLPIACTVSVPFALLVGKQVPAKTVGEFAALIKSQPGKMFQGSSGNGSPDHLTGVLLGKAMDWDFQHIPYKGNAQALTDLAAGNISFMFAGALQTALPLVKDGRVRILAVTSPNRSALLPEVPTISETLSKGFDTGTWQALVAPRNTPVEVVNLLNSKMNEILADPAVKARLLQQGAEPFPGSPQQCGQFMEKEYRRWTAVIRDNKVHID